MKKQNEPKKTKHYTAYNEKKPTYLRHQDVIESIPEHCWWLRQYLKGIYDRKK